MQRAVRVVLILILVGIVTTVLYAGWKKNGPNQFEAAFSPGGNVALDLSAGGYTIRGTAENRIQVIIDSQEDRDVQCRMNVTGNRAKVEIDGPSNNFHATILVPQRTDLDVDQTVGELRVDNVEGNKRLALHIGQLHVELPASDPQPTFDGSIIIGDLHVNPWNINKGGFCRDFYTRSSGPYSIKARVDIGQLDVENAPKPGVDSHAQKSDDTDRDVSDEDSEDKTE